MDNKKTIDTLEMYRNYLYALQERQEYGDKYGDTDELVEMYEEKLKIKKLGGKNETNNN